MAIQNIMYEDKEALQNDTDVPNKNKVTDEDMNEIKKVVNNNGNEIDVFEQTVKQVQEENREEINNIYKDVQASKIHYETEQAKSLYIDDATDSRGKIEVEGNVEQEVTETSPSIDHPSPLKILGDNINVLDDKKFQNVKIENSASISSLGNVDIELKNTTYCARIYFTDGTYVIDGNLALYAYNSNNTSLFGLGNTGATRVTNAEQVKYVKLACNSTGIETYKGKTIKGIKIEEGETPTSYSPMGQGSTKISRINKNRFNKNTAVKGYRLDSLGEYYVQSDYFTSDYISAKPETYYAVNYNVPSVMQRICFYDKNKKFISANISSNVFQTPQNCKYIRICNKLTYLDTAQLEENKNSTDFVEHEQTDYLLYIQQEMLTGDYFDLDRKKEVHGWNKKILTGTENTWQLYTTGTRRFGLDITGDLPVIILGKYGTGYCTHFKVLTTTGTDLTMFLQVEPNHFYIAIVDTNSRWSDVTALKNELQELYNANTPVTIYYKTVETTELDLTEAQIKALEQLNKLRFYKNVNNIFTLEDIALLQADYEVDLQTLKGIPGPKRR